MTRGKRAPQLTAEERERNRRLADERHAEIKAAAERATTERARDFLRGIGELVEGDSVVERLRRLDRYRHALAERARIRYQPTMRQQQARPAAGVVEIEF
ncbi:MAG: hypothetical protein JSS57_04390 [Proteobacteria bacterium]|nr:hypothetical protein [Pseudomonadota bacterium]